MKKTFSPVRILNVGNPKIEKSTITLDVENRYLFTNLKDVGITWQLGERTGSATVDIPAGKKGTLTLDVGTIPANPPELGLKFEDPRGFIADEFRLQLMNVQSRGVDDEISCGAHFLQDCALTFNQRLQPESFFHERVLSTSGFVTCHQLTRRRFEKHQPNSMPRTAKRLE
jgi:hypothetical protein